MLRHRKIKRAALPILLAAYLAAGPVHADCTSPAGKEADEIYNSSFHTMQFCNGTSWISEGGASGASGITLITTQTASNSASLQFTNLPTSYNTLFLNCTGLLVSNGSTGIVFFVGEGAGPTWQTGAHYTDVGDFWGASSATFSTSTNAGLFVGSIGSTTIPESIRLHIDNVGSSSIYKEITASLNVYTAGVGYFGESAFGYWNNDTNPVTGLELAASGGGTISSGSCTLYGMN